ncbi:MAG: Flagellar cap protein FliD [Pseudolabrys sp.]|nr:Flagellar cap protein FliD [Pseudolabrys sp.]
MTVSSATSSSSTSPTSALTSNVSTNLSSIDWNALITSQVDAKLAAATTIQTSITNNQAKIAAYQKLQSLLSNLANAAGPFSTSNTSSLSSSAFSAATAAITATGDVSPAAVLGMTVNNGAPSGSYTLTVQQVAQAQKAASATVTSNTSALGYIGTFSLGLAGGATANISVTSGMSLQDVAAAINAQESTTNVQASVLQVGAGQYELVLTAQNDNANIVTSSVSGDNVLNKIGATDGSGNFTDVLQTSQPAKFTLDGIQMTRNTNDISDVLTNTTFHLYQATPPGTSLNITLSPDTSTMTTDLQNFVTAYNALRDYVVSQQATNSDGTASSSAVLFGDSTMNGLSDQIQFAISSIVGGLSMSDLGLSFNNSNDLQLDTTTLQSTLTSKLSGVESLLANQLTASSSNLLTISAGDSPPSSFTLDVTVDGSGNLASASVGGDSSMFSIVGDTIIGNAGTAYSGIAFEYTGTTSQSISVTGTNGIASMIKSLATSVSNTTNGSLQTLISGLQTQDTSLSQQVSDIQSAASAYQIQLQTLYAKYQAEIASASTTLNYLQALLNQKSTH